MKRDSEENQHAIRSELSREALAQQAMPLEQKASWKPLPQPPNTRHLNLEVGASGYHFQDWVGLFYPPRPSRRTGQGEGRHDWFAFYQLYFSFLEINHTFYKESNLQQFVDLERRSKPDMLFAVKVHKGISHPTVWDVEEGKARMRAQVTATSPLLETGRFYSFLLQLDDRLERNHKVLDYLLQVASVALQERMDLHIEFRNITWHQESVLCALKDSGIGICNTDMPRVKHAFPLKAYATSAKGYVRYNGLNLAQWDAGRADRMPSGKKISPAARLQARNNRYDYLYTEDELIERVQGQIRLLQKTATVAVAYNNHFQIKAVLNAIRNMEMVKAKLNAFRS